MAKYVKEHPWKIIEEGFHPEENRLYESFMSIGNGHMGHRGNFEEDYSGVTLQGSYVAGVYYPDKTRVGWWKNGYPEYFAKVLNATNIIGIQVFIDGKPVDLALYPPKNFKRVLDMKEACLHRSFELEIDGKNFAFEVKRFMSYVDIESGAISYSVTALDDKAEITFIPYLDGDVRNEDANYDEVFWDRGKEMINDNHGLVSMTTRKTGFFVASAMTSTLSLDGQTLSAPKENFAKDKFVSQQFKTNMQVGQTATLNKYITVASSRDHEASAVEAHALITLDHISNKGFDQLYKENADKWAEMWAEGDIVIEGDVAAQQGIRFNIFHLKCTYSGDDPRLNIGPKGFTGEKYGGSTYWDTEAYCLPFYLSTSHEQVAKNLLIYRYEQLDKAIDNAALLGLKGALYPMVTMNGEECHNEWEITFEEIHRNGAIAYAIFNYIRYTGDQDYLVEYGLDVLLNIARFWADRVHYVPHRDKYMMHGVTGPNEYDNNVNNNWYTNRIAAWCLEYALEALAYVKGASPEKALAVQGKYGFEASEFEKWVDIQEKMFYPYVEDLGIFEQSDGYMDKEQILVKDLDPVHLPLNQNWSWDRILRSCFIKQADVLQGLFFLSDQYDLDVKKRNFDFYEPRTVHESSLSPCVYSIIAGEIGYHDKAYELYVRTARLDLDNYNNDTDDGLHITSMAGTWMAIQYGFGGFSVSDGKPMFNPFIPENWDSYTFKMLFRERPLHIQVDKDHIEIRLVSGDPIQVGVYNKVYDLATDTALHIPLDHTRKI